MGPGAEPLVVHAQVAWVRRSPPEAAGVTFLSAPRQPTQAEPEPGGWIDVLLSARIRQLPVAAGPERRACAAEGGEAVRPPAA
jgi:hypothetical protein